jgi:hypothetical protein
MYITDKFNPNYVCCNAMSVTKRRRKPCTLYKCGIRVMPVRLSLSAKLFVIYAYGGANVHHLYWGGDECLSHKV